MDYIVSIVRKKLGVAKRFFWRICDVFFSKLTIDDGLMQKTIKDFGLEKITNQLREEYENIAFKEGENADYYKHILTYIHANEYLSNNPFFVYPPNVAVIDFLLKNINSGAIVLEYGCGLGNLLIYLRNINYRQSFGYDNYSQIQKETVISFLERFSLKDVIVSKERALTLKNKVAVCIGYFWSGLGKELLLKEAQNSSLEYILIDYPYAPRYIRNFKIVGIYEKLLIVFKRI